MYIMKKTRKTKRRRNVRRRNVKRRTLKGGFIENISNTGTIINGVNVYSVELDDCKRYFFYRDEDYVVINHGENDYIVNMKTDESNNNSIIQLLQDNKNKLQRKTGLRKLNCLYVRTDKCVSYNITNTNDKISQLNDALHTVCPNLTIQLDYMYNYKGVVESFEPTLSQLLLCICNETGCISSLHILIEDNVLTISSKTGTNYLKRKYNRLLWSIAIIISKLLDQKVSVLRAYLANDITKQTLINNFQANEDNIKDDALDISINAKSIENAEHVFSKTLSEIVC